MKISNWESIPYSVGLQCPNGDDGSLMDGKSKVIGWCDTPKGLMKVCECQVCFSFVLVFCLERWSYNNFPYYDKDPWND